MQLSTDAAVLAQPIVIAKNSLKYIKGTMFM